MRKRHFLKSFTTTLNNAISDLDRWHSARVRGACIAIDDLINESIKQTNVRRRESHVGYVFEAKLAGVKNLS